MSVCSVLGRITYVMPILALADACRRPPYPASGDLLGYNNWGDRVTYRPFCIGIIDDYGSSGGCREFGGFVLVCAEAAEQGPLLNEIRVQSERRKRGLRSYTHSFLLHTSAPTSWECALIVRLRVPERHAWHNSQGHGHRHNHFGQDKLLTPS